MPVLRLFHTELETVYEEFNMGQDRDGDRQFQALMEGLFPHHPLGRDVIGLPEHLKNPSQVNIMKFFDTWYVPNNMAIILSGDIDCEATINRITSYNVCYTKLLRSLSAMLLRFQLPSAFLLPLTSG